MRTPLAEQGPPLEAEESVSPELPSSRGISAALAAVAAGFPVVVVDDEHESGDLVFAGECASTQLMAFTVRYTSGFVCAALPADRCNQLELPPINPLNQDELTYCVAVDRRDNGTGISAAARARTARALSAPESTPTDFVRPGHMVPVEVRRGGVLERVGRAEAALDLVRLAGRQPAAVFATVMVEQGSGEVADSAALLDFAERHELEVISIAALVDHRRRTEPQMRCLTSETVTTAEGGVDVLAFQRLHSDGSHLAFLAGAIHPDVPVYVHTECVSGDVGGLATCTCGNGLRQRLATFIGMGDGIVVYIRQDGSSLVCGHSREFDRRERATINEVAAEVLSKLCVTSLRLFNDDHELADVLRSFGMRVYDS